MPALLWTRSLLAGALVLAATALAIPEAAHADDTATLITRGEYLTHGAGQCSDCHGQGLVGAALPGTPSATRAMTAPSLVGLKMFDKDADAVAFLQTTKLPDGKNALQPMPRYQFNAADATAIVAYLRSLK